MRVALISDVHCCGLACPRAANFVTWLDQLDADALWMLGDIFHYGWVFGADTQPEYAPVYMALQRVKARGIAMVFVPGNHDFRVANLMASRFGAEVCGPHVRHVDGCSVHLAHGDECERSILFRAMSWVLRSEFVDGAMRMLGHRLGTWILRRLAGAPHIDGEVLWDGSREALLSHLDTVDLAVMGHAHFAWSHKDERGKAVVLGAGVAGARLLSDGRLV